MKTNRLHLAMQMITVVPLILFLVIYTSFTLYTVGVLVLLLGVLGYSIYRYKSELGSAGYPLLLLLVVSFLVYGFYGLGSLYAPQTFQSLHQKNRIVTFEMEQPVSVDRLCYYIGIDKNAKFVLLQQEGNHWKKFYTYDKNFPFSFRWNCIGTDLVTSKIRMRMSKGQMMLGEVKLFDGNRSVPFRASKKYVNDEPEIAIDNTYFGRMFFDEIYHGRTAFEIIHGLKVYENTHPYLGKILIGLGIRLFDMTPFGWRFINVLFGALLIIAAYYFAKVMFGKKLFAFAAALLMSYSFMHLTQARMAQIDTFGVFFVFVSYLFLYLFILKQRLRLLLISGVFFGLASAIKWSAVFAAGGFVLIAVYLLAVKYPLDKRFAGYKLLLYGVLSYGIVAVAIYGLTFYEIYLQTGSLQNIIDYQLNMFKYHQNVVSEHPYGSAWWTWMADYRPMCYYREQAGGMHRSITAFGNPAIFWTGAASILYLGYVVLRRHTLSTSFILLAFLGLYLPYALIGRQMFIYHFYYAVPFLIMAIVYSFRDVLRYLPAYRRWSLCYFVIVVVLFLVYYPVLSGYEVPKWYVDYILRWFPGWWL